MALALNNARNKETSITYRSVSLVGRVFANGPGDRGSVQGRVIPKTQKMVFDATLHDTQYYKVWI